MAKKASILKPIMHHERLIIPLLLTSMALMIYAIPALFISEETYSASIFISFSLTSALAYYGLFSKSDHTNLIVSLLLSLHALYTIFIDGEYAIICSICILLCVYMMFILILNFFKNPTTFIIDKNLAIQSIYIFALSFSLALALGFEFFEPSFIVDWQYISLGMLTIIAIVYIFKLPAYLTMAYLLIYSLYYIYVFIRFAPFSYPFLLSIFIVHILFACYATHYLFTVFSLEDTNDDLTE